jgi:hypothetical protein
MTNHLISSHSRRLFPSDYRSLKGSTSVACSKEFLSSLSVIHRSTRRGFDSLSTLSPSPFYMRSRVFISLSLSPLFLLVASYLWDHIMMIGHEVSWSLLFVYFGFN